MTTCLSSDELAMTVPVTAAKTMRLNSFMSSKMPAISVFLVVDC